jgi:glycerophosphoryl diester phosphodiesterase
MKSKFKGPKTIGTLLVILLLYTIFQTPDISATTKLPTILGAHRGNSVDYYENTLDAIKSALEDPKYKFIEFDIQYTKDKKIIVYHDTSLFRRQSKFIDIAESTYEELNQASDYKVPLYEEVMDLIGNKKKVNIEIKSQGNLEDDKEIVDYIIKDCKEQGILDQVLISAISSDVVEYISLTYPKLLTGKIYWIHSVTYSPFESTIKTFYEEMDKIGADYIMLHGINLKNYGMLTKLKPKEKTLVFWYFDDRMLLLQKDKLDVMW